MKSETKTKIVILIAGLILSVVFSVIVLSTQKSSNIYPQTAMVVSTDEDQNLLTLMTANGNVFVYETSVEDWLTGDICSLTMDSMGTEDVKDDKIQKIRYSGRTEHYAYLPLRWKGMKD